MYKGPTLPTWDQFIQKSACAGYMIAYKTDLTGAVCGVCGVTHISEVQEKELVINNNRFCKMQCLMTPCVLRKFVR